MEWNAGTTDVKRPLELEVMARQRAEVICLTVRQISASSTPVHFTMAAESPSGRIDGVMFLRLSVEKRSLNAVSAKSLCSRPTPVFHGFRHDLPTARKFPDCQAGRSTIPDEPNYVQTRPFSRLTDSQVSFYKDKLGRGHNCFVGLDFIDQVSKNVFAPWWQT